MLLKQDRVLLLARLLEQLKQVILAKARICKWKMTSLLMIFLSAILWCSRRA